MKVDHLNGELLPNGQILSLNRRVMLGHDGTRPVYGWAKITKATFNVLRYLSLII